MIATPAVEPADWRAVLRFLLGRPAATVAEISSATGFGDEAVVGAMEMLVRWNVVGYAGEAEPT